MSKPYTPDTETVREQYTREQPPHIGTVSSKCAEFDRWLNEVKAQAWDRGHGAPCDEWWDSDMCREYHPNPYRKGN